MFENRIRDALERASKIADTDLSEFYYHKQSSVESVDSVENEVEKIRRELPNNQLRKRFDRELEKQVKQQKKYHERQIEAFRTRKSNLRLLDKITKRIALEGVQNPRPYLIPAHLWKQCQHILADNSGFAARYYSRICFHKVGVSLVHRAALCYDADGKPRYSYKGNGRDAYRARLVLAGGLLLLCLSRRTGRFGHGWNRLVKGIPQDAFLAALRDPFTGRQPCKTAFNGTHHRIEPDAEVEITDGNVGYLTALKNIGLTYTRQTKTKEKHLAKLIKGWEDISPEEQLGKRTPSGLFCSLARYWIVSSEWTDPIDAAKRARLWVAWLGATLPESVDFDAVTFSPTRETVEPSEQDTPREAPD